VERTFIRERQRVGIDRAKKAGAYKGRPAKLDHTRMVRMGAEGLGPTEIARTIGCSRGMVYKALARRAGAGVEAD
jgi:DNA invertase Pin-like site-specific DNA recombinase